MNELCGSDLGAKDDESDSEADAKEVESYLLNVDDSETD
jgi:hypothetical protein